MEVTSLIIKNHGKFMELCFLISVATLTLPLSHCTPHKHKLLVESLCTVIEDPRQTPYFRRENFTFESKINPFHTSHDFCLLFTGLLMLFSSTYCKQYGSRSDSSQGSSLIRAYNVYFHDKILSEI